jgi:hypothetical protein
MITFEESRQGSGAQFGMRGADCFVHAQQAASGIIPTETIDGARPQRTTEIARSIGILHQLVNPIGQ